MEKPSRRWFLKAAAGASFVGLGGSLFYIASDAEAKAARKQKRADGRPRLPPGQRLVKQLKPMGGTEGSPRLSDFGLKITGLVKDPKTLDYVKLLALPRVRRKVDVHCVTGWSCLGVEFDGILIKDVLNAAGGVKDGARHVIIAAHAGYTANVQLKEAIASDCLLAFRHNRAPMHRRHGAPVRAVIPSLYFWKSAKWITGLKVTSRDQPGYWEKRGYHNHADPWKEERYG